MKFSTFLFALILTNQVVGQHKICGQLDYTISLSFPANISKTDYLMVFNEATSFSKEVNIEKSEKKAEKKVIQGEADGYTSTTENVFIARKDFTPRYFYNAGDAFYFKEIVGHPVVVREDDEMKWVLSPEEKEIGGFACQRATTSFRGNDYIAWYTPEIPVPFGPWKFRGLPGLIIEVYDVTERFLFVANKISLQNIEHCQGENKPTDISEAVSLSEYRQIRNDDDDIFFAKLSSKQPPGSPPITRSKDCHDCGLLEYFGPDEN